MILGTPKIEFDEKKKTLNYIGKNWTTKMHL